MNQLNWMTLLAVWSYFPLNIFAANFVCYYPNWSMYRQGIGKFTVDNINPNLCTHLMYAFTVLSESSYKMIVHDSWSDIDNQGFAKVVALKNKNPNLKVMVSLGGWNDSNDGTGKYSRLLSSSTNIDTFVSSVVTFLQTYKFDGLDIDYEHPTSTDKTGYKNLIIALKTAFKPYGFLLSAAVSASASNIDAGFDIPAMSQNMDFINVMTYDFHGASWEPSTANHHSPLRNRPGETTNANSDYSISYWIAKGFPASKINMGIPLYGLSWKLTSNSVVPPAPANGPGPAGTYTGQAGFMAYYEICTAVLENSWTVTRDPNNAIGPIAVSPTSPKTWVGYDDPGMAIVKSNYILSKGLGGALVWDISMDDFSNTCGGGANPVMTAISNTLKNTPSTTTTTKPITSTTKTTSTKITTTTKATTTTKPTGTFVCPSPNGLFPDPTSCSYFYNCGNGTPHRTACGTGLYFNPTYLVCDWPANVPSCPISG